jgi:chromosome segregation ATPase
MGDLHFKCSGCQQSLVADDSGVGVSFRCPHCNTSQIVPPTSTIPVQGSREGKKPVSVLPSRASSGGGAAQGGGLWVAQERVRQNEHQSAERAVALIERDQRISALTAERDWLASQLDEERQRRQAIEPELDLARGEWAVAEKRASEFEAGYHQSSTRLQQAEIELRDLSGQLELVKSERSEAVLELAHQHETLAELNLELSKARAECAETEQILGRARADLEHTTNDLAAAEAIAEEAATEADESKALLNRLRSERDNAVEERDKLKALVEGNPGMAEYVDAKFERERVEAELRETQARLDGYCEKIEELTAEREALKRERTELQLRVAALRDAHDDTQLQQDNEILRRMVERLNEELKGVHPDVAKRKRREASGGVGGLARAVAARYFVPDTDVAEGR